MKSEKALRSNLTLLGFCLSLSTSLLVPSCKAIPSAMGSLFGNLIAAAVNNYAPGHSQAVRTLVQTLWNTGADAGNKEKPSADAPSLRLEIALLKQTTERGREVLELVVDGDVLRDGHGAERAGDKFRVVFRANEDTYIYIFGVDATGWVSPMFPIPHSRHINPIEKAREYELPDPEFAYALNEHRGIEHVYIVASEESRPDIESLLEAFAGQKQPAPQSATRVGERAVLSRGFDTESIGTDIVVDTALGRHEVTPSAFLSSLSGNDLVITRWFRHE